LACSYRDHKATLSITELILVDVGGDVQTPTEHMGGALAILFLVFLFSRNAGRWGADDCKMKRDDQLRAAITDRITKAFGARALSRCVR